MALTRVLQPCLGAMGITLVHISMANVSTWLQRILGYINDWCAKTKKRGLVNIKPVSSKGPKKSFLHFTMSRYYCSISSQNREVQIHTKRGKRSSPITTINFYSSLCPTKPRNHSLSKKKKNQELGRSLFHQILLFSPWTPCRKCAKRVFL